MTLAKWDSPPKLVIFDWDGTLVDSIDPILRGFQLAYDRYGHPCPPPDDLRATIGLPLTLAFEQLSPGLPTAAMVTLYREYWFSPERPPSPWANGALELMDWLEQQGVTMAVATGKSRAGLEHELEALATGHRFAATRSADDAKPKPHPDMIEQILTQLGFAPNEAILIGDSPLDISMGNAAGVTTFGVLGGVGVLEALTQVGAQAVLTALAELKPGWAGG
jgi:phosphoglycolate phosphatase